jgi:hypothetical protein
MVARLSQVAAKAGSAMKLMVPSAMVTAIDLSESRLLTSSPRGKTWKYAKS